MSFVKWETQAFRTYNIFCDESIHPIFNEQLVSQRIGKSSQYIFCCKQDHR